MSNIPTELYVSVELYVPKSSSLPRKQLTRRKTEKRESVRTLSATLEGSSKKVKEKSSWLGLPSRTGAGSEPWHPATCTLVEEGEGCVFKVFVDDSKLYQSVYIHKLNHSDIRLVHPSLVDRKGCLGIYSTPGDTSWSPTNNTEPLYLYFTQAPLMNTWLALLRSYAAPEIYGRWNAVSDGGLYRMWRQVKLTCIQGRNLGAQRPLPDDNMNPDADVDAMDLDVFCEIFVNGVLCGRTTTKKCLGNPDWSESFTFTDLSPFDTLEIVVFKERRVVKPVVVGSILVYLMNFRRGEAVEGWFPVINSTSSHVGVQLGELRLKMRADEEIILPSNAYAGMHKVLQSRNFLDWIEDFESRLKLKDTIEHVMAIAQTHDVLVPNIKELAGRDVKGPQSTHNTIFRGNTVFTKVMEIFMLWYGKAFLEASLGPVIRRLCTDKVMIEIDPGRSSNRHNKEIDRMVALLVYWCGEFWNSIYEARQQCPNELRQVFAHVRYLVETRYATTDEQKQEYKDLPWQSVSSFLFLRFFVPAILNPHLFGIWPGLPEEQVRRSLTLVAKVMQSLANLNTTVQKEEFMHAVKDFLAKSSSAMLEYINCVSTPKSEEPSKPSKEERNRQRLQNFVSQRAELLRRLHREALPMPPHSLDGPKHYASIASLVVRYSRRYNYNVPSSDSTDPFDKLCLKSLEVEGQALTRVSELAKKLRREHAPSTSPEGPSPPMSPLGRERRTSLQSKHRRSRRTPRPATAPATGESEGLSNSNSPDISVPSSPTSHNATRMFSRTSIANKQSQFPASAEDDQIEGEPRSLPTARPPLSHHPRSTSTDSALFRKTSYPNMSSGSSVSHAFVEATPPDNLDESGKKRKGLLRGILVRR